MARHEIWEFNADHMFWPEISSIAFGTFIFWRFHKHWNRLITDPIIFIGAIIKAGANATAVSSLLTRRSNFSRKLLVNLIFGSNKAELDNLKKQGKRFFDFKLWYGE